MRKVKILVASVVMAFSLLVPFAGTAGAVVCIEETSSCCGPITILGKEYNFISC